MEIAYLNEEMNTAGKMEYYLAQIAAEVRRTIAKEPKSVSLKDFLHPVKFIRQKLEKKNDINEINRVKNFWFAATGFTGKKNVQHRHRKSRRTSKTR